MFYIHSADGRLFAGSLEELRQTPDVMAQSGVADSKTFDSTLKQETNKLDSAGSYSPSSRAVSQYQDLLRKNNAQEAVYHAYQIMSHPVVTLSERTNWLEAYEQFQKSPHKLLPVININRKLVGVLSRHDLYHTMLTQPEQLRDSATINQIESVKQPVISANPVTDIRRIANILIERELAAMPVIEESDELVGIVSRTDILRCVAQEPPLSLWC